MALESVGAVSYYSCELQSLDVLLGEVDGIFFFVDINHGLPLNVACLRRSFPAMPFMQRQIEPFCFFNSLRTSGASEYVNASQEMELETA
jgi:hypothetical protein